MYNHSFSVYFFAETQWTNQRLEVFDNLLSVNNFDSCLLVVVDILPPDQDPKIRTV